MTTSNAEGPLAVLREHHEVIDQDLDLLKRFAPDARRLVDVGAGRGSFVTAANQHGRQALALDMQQEAAHLWPRLQVPGVLGDGLHMPFTENSFDVVRMKEVIEHVPDPLAFVREARRVLRSGGVLIAHVPTPYSQFYPVGNFWDDYTHVRPFSKLALQRLIADAGMEMLQVDAYTSGRNSVERAVGKLLARVLPHIYRLVAKRP
jgi:ubiquinone/menaquinone biosynthesis C-methylase UbiE